MASPLIATKLFAPRLRSGVVARLRLSDRLIRGAGSKLTLISAPAGFGKTTLLAAWLAADKPAAHGVAWLSLDHTDNDALSFWSHLIIALQTVAKDAGVMALQMLQSGQQADETVLAVLLNELGALPGIVHLVLDDYHAIDQPGIEAGMAFVVDHLPANIRLVISTRADPALPLPRLRARGELVEIRSADLRFTAAEISIYLTGIAGLGLSARDVAKLEERTEGWIAALQLAALSLEGREDASNFIAEFTGSGRYIVDYLVEEVLQRQPEDVRRFLLATCILGRMCASLCDAVTGLVGTGRPMLDRLDRHNLFVVPLDDRRQWYRYHHLFADVLLAHLSEEERNDLPALHCRASTWFERHGEPGEAIRHAFAANDFGLAAELIERAIPAIRAARQEATMRTWIQALPDSEVRSRPVLGVNFVGALVANGDLDVEDRLDDAERALASTMVGDDPELRRLPAAIEMYRAALAQARADVPGMIGHAQRAIDVATPDDHFSRAGAEGFLGIAYWTGGELDTALRFWTLCLNDLGRAGHVADVVSSAIGPAEISIVQGRLGEAARIYEHALLIAADQASPPRGLADVYAALSRLHRERNDLDGARRHLQTSYELGDFAGLPQHPYRWRVAMAEVRMAEGQWSEALSLWDDAERRHVGDFFPNARPFAAIKARIYIGLGQLSEADRWVIDSGVTAGDDLTYLREFEHVTLARLLLARWSIDDARRLLGRLLDAAEGGGRMGSVIEISVLQALALGASGDLPAALVPLKRALELAEPEGYARVFIDEGEAMADLLKAAVKRRIAPAYAQRLLGALGSPQRAVPTQHPDLIEALSEREIDVLRLLRSDLSGPDMARELTVSLNTVRTHTKNIYEKLGVNNRRAAVRRAEELKLLGHRSDR